MLQEGVKKNRMFKFLKNVLRSKKEIREKEPEIRLMDLESKTLKNGDKVMSLRYDLGESILRITPEGIFYESVATGEKISYTRMVDASTNCQKVRKIE